MYKASDTGIDWDSCGSLIAPEVGKISAYKPEYFTDLLRWDTTNNPRRIEGQYGLGTATAELTLERSRNRNGEFETWEYRLEVRFVDLKDGLELYTLIRAGKIVPLVDYKGDQPATAKEQFRDLWREFLVLGRVWLRKQHIA
jgi:hypothetical protein